MRGEPDLRRIEFHLRENQHDDDTVAIGMAARAYLEEENFEPAKDAEFIGCTCLLLDMTCIILLRLIYFFYVHVFR